MVATRTSRSRGQRNAPAGLRWDQAQLAPIVLIRAGEEVLADRAVSSLLAQAKAKDPTTEVTRLEAATYEPTSSTPSCRPPCSESPGSSTSPPWSR